MIEIELVSSYQAIEHLFSDNNHGIYCKCDDCNNSHNLYDRFKQLLKEAASRTQKIIYNNSGALPMDSLIRIDELSKLLVEDIKVNGCKVWPVVRKLIGKKVSSRVYDEPGMSECLSYSIDETFFAAGFLTLSSQRSPQNPAADAHVHFGGAVPWNIAWNWLMNRMMPTTFFARSKFNRITGSEAIILLKKAREKRENLLMTHGIPDTIGRDPECDSILFGRLYKLSPEILDDDNVRDYVLIRSLMRREMICANVSSLDDFVRDAWRRYWGFKPDVARLFGKMALLKRFQRLERRKMEAAADFVCTKLGIQRVSFRMNLDPKNSIGAQELRSAVEILERHQQDNFTEKPGLIVHAKRPKIPKESEKALQDWNRNLLLIEREQVGLKEAISLDIAGSERNIHFTWLTRAINNGLKSLKRVRNEKSAMTVHAGEDFWDPWNGLSRVFFTVRSFIKMKFQPRIGHGSIIGIDPYQLRWSQYICPRWARIEGLKFTSNCASRLGASTDTVEYISKSLRELKKGSKREFLLIKPDKLEKDFFYKVQKCVGKYLKEKNSIIESNPTSNLQILGLPGYDWLPIWGLLALNITVVLGTDNPGIFNTSIEEEYARLYAGFNARKKNKVDDFMPYHLRLGTMEWVDIEKRLRESTLKLSL